MPSLTIARHFTELTTTLSHKPSVVKCVLSLSSGCEWSLTGALPAFISLFRSPSLAQELEMFH